MLNKAFCNASLVFRIVPSIKKEEKYKKMYYVLCAVYKMKWWFKLAYSLCILATSKCGVNIGADDLSDSDSWIESTKHVSGV